MVGKMTTITLLSTWLLSGCVGTTSPASSSMADGTDDGSSVALIDPQGSDKPPTKNIALPAVAAKDEDIDDVAQAVLEKEAEQYGNAPDISRKYNYKVRGKRYRVFANQDNFQQIGTASWYGPGFNGKKTASGEIFDMNDLTAAHKTLPLGCMVQVTNLHNGKKIIVRINDRGPFHGGRVIDLSKRAAQQLGIIAAGHAKVHIKSLPE